MKKLKPIILLFICLILLKINGKANEDEDFYAYKVEAPQEVDLTRQGNVDWAYFNDTDFYKYEKKNIPQSFIKDLKMSGKLEDKINNKNRTYVSYSDGTKNTSAVGENKSIVFLGKDSGFEMSLPTDKERYYINLYVGVWGAKADVKLMVNDELKDSIAIESESVKKNDTKYYMVQFKYSNLTASDKVKVVANIDKVYDDKWGNINLSAITLSDKNDTATDETLSSRYWSINHKGGVLNEALFNEGGNFNKIPLRTDEYRGISWKINSEVVDLKKSDTGEPIYRGNYKNENLDLNLDLRYELKNENIFRVVADIQNNSNEEVEIDSASLQFGFNTYLERYPDYNSQLFPTLLRVEPTHAWGYFQMPNGNILAFNTDSKVASYTIDYQKGAHRIYSAQLDVLKSGKLPQRHPQDMNKLKGNEKKQVILNIYPIEEPNRVDLVKKTISENSNLPMFDSEKYTIDNVSKTEIKIYSKSPINKECSVITPSNKEEKLRFEKITETEYAATFDGNGKELGVYRIQCTNNDGYTSEMSLTVRNDWSWYIKSARKAAIEAPQKGGTHAEQYYGFYSAYIAKKYFPDKVLDEEVSKKLDEVYSLMYYNKSGRPASERERIQNHSTMMGILIDSFEADGNKEHLWRAEVLADFLLSKQWRNGGYYSWFTDYTSVIYPAKSLMEMCYVEKRLSEDVTLSEEERNNHKERYDKYMASLERAMDKLVALDGNFDTEGQQTYEDGANSCTVTQLSEFALMFPKGSEKRQKYTDAAIKYFNRHTSHQQLAIPDSRMNGATLRFWEAQYDISIEPSKISPNMMNSPHGWSAWNVYALFNLYELTQDREFLIRGENAIGTLSQLMGNDGILNWAFIPDPQRRVKLFVEDKENSSGDKVVGKYTDEVDIGEQYLPMVSYWWKAKPNTYTKGHKYMPFGAYQGCGSDQDVHEIFKAIGEVALTKGYIHENEDGSLIAYNCSAKKENGRIEVFPKETVVSNISVILKNAADVDVHFYDGTKTEKVNANEHKWIRTSENLQSENPVSDDAYLKNLSVKNKELSEKFDKNKYNYTVIVDPEIKYIELIPEKNNEKQEIFINGVKLDKEHVSININPYEIKEVEIKVYSEAAKIIKHYYVNINSYGKAKKVDKADITDIKSDSENTDEGEEGPIKNLFDNDKTTIWISKTIDKSENSYNWVEVKFNKPKHLLALKYLPRQFGGLDGNILEYEVEVSSDGKEYKTVAVGKWENNTEMKTALFDVKGVTNVRVIPKKFVGDIVTGAELGFVEIEDENSSVNDNNNDSNNGNINDDNKDKPDNGRPDSNDNNNDVSIGDDKNIIDDSEIVNNIGKSYRKENDINTDDNKKKIPDTGVGLPCILYSVISLCVSVIALKYKRKDT